MSNSSSTVDIGTYNYLGHGHEYMLLFRLIIRGYVGMVLSLFGIVGNIITILVLLSPSMRTTSTNIYLTALSCSNILFLLMFILSHSMKSILHYRSYMRKEPPSALEIFLMRLPTTSIYVTILLSVIYLTIGVSIDRLIFIKFPLKARQILTQRRTFITIFLIYIFSILLCIPFWFEQQYDPVKKRCPVTNITWKIYNYTRLYMFIPVFYLIPLIILTCTNITIIHNLISKKHLKKNLSVKTNRSAQSDNYVILILVTVTILFDLCRLIYLIIRAWHAIDNKNLSGRILSIIAEFGLLLLVFNISINVIVHCFGEKFREILIKFILHLIRNHDRQRNLPRRSSDKQKQQNFKSSEQKQIISSDNYLTVANDLNKSSDLSNKSNENLIQNSSINQQEVSPLMTNSEEISVINDDVSFKPDRNLDFYACVTDVCPL